MKRFFIFLKTELKLSLPIEVMPKAIQKIISFFR